MASLSPNSPKFYTNKLWITTTYAITVEQRPLFGVPRVVNVDRFDCIYYKWKGIYFIGKLLNMIIFVKNETDNIKQIITITENIVPF